MEIIRKPRHFDKINGGDIIKMQKENTGYYHALVGQGFIDNNEGKRIQVVFITNLITNFTFHITGLSLPLDKDLFPKFDPGFYVKEVLRKVPREFGISGNVKYCLSDEFTAPQIFNAGDVIVSNGAIGNEYFMIGGNKSKGDNFPLDELETFSITDLISGNTLTSDLGIRESRTPGCLTLNEITKIWPGLNVVAVIQNPILEGLE